MTDEEDLKNVERRWIKEIEQALLRNENTRRAAAGESTLDATTFVFVSNSQSAFRFLNWKVWTVRYSINLDMLLEIILTSFGRARHYLSNDIEVRLGLPVSMVTGVEARRKVEDAVFTMYPNGENYKSKNQAEQLPPIDLLNYDDADELVATYASAMKNRRKPPETVKLLRNYRGKNGN
jgi:hypothetical protein